MMGDIEETFFQANVPGKYSTWKEENDDRNLHQDHESEGDEEDDPQDIDFNQPSHEGENVDLGYRLQSSSLPDSVKAGILEERMQKHRTGVKGMLADHKAIKAIEKGERIMKEQQRNYILLRMAQGAQSAQQDILENDVSDEDDDEDFLAEYRAKRLAEMKSSLVLPSFGQVKEISSQEELLSVLNDTDRRVYVIVHLYETSVSSSVRMNKLLEEIACKRKNTLFARMHASRNEIEVDIATLPVLSVYRAGECVEVLAGIAVNYGLYFALEDVEHMLDNIISS